jgi:hypothetical protein
MFRGSEESLLDPLFRAGLLSTEELHRHLLIFGIHCQFHNASLPFVQIPNLLKLAGIKSQLRKCAGTQKAMKSGID